MKPRHKMLWLSPEDQDSNGRLVELLDGGWAPAFYMPTEKSVMVVLWKQTDALDGLSMAVDTALTKEKNVNKSTK